MADDQLIYGINFNLDEGVEKVRKEWAERNKELGELFSANFSIKVDESSVKNFESIIRNLQSINPIDSATSESIRKLIEELTELEKVIQSVDVLNKNLASTSSSTAEQIQANTINIAAAEQALAKAREESEKANLAAQRVETERSRTLIAETKALREVAKESESAAKSKNKFFDVDKEAKVKEDWSKRYAESYKELSFGLDQVIAKYQELAQISPSATVGSGIPELISRIKSLSKTYVDFESDIMLQTTIQEVESAYSNLTLQLGELNKGYKNTSESAKEYTASSESVSASTSAAASNIDKVAKSVSSTSKQISDVSFVAADSFKQLSKRAQEDAQTLIGYQNALAATRNEISTLNKSFEIGTISESKYIVRKAQLVSLQKDQTSSVNEYQKILQYNVQLLNSEAGSYKAVEAELKLNQIALKKLSVERNASIKDIEKLQSRSRDLTEELERQRIASGKYALTAGSYGQNIRDLTYAIRLIDPALGILVQRTQRISVLNDIWNKTNNAITRSLKVTAQTATTLLVGALGALSLAVAGVVRWYQKWKKVQDEIKSIRSGFLSSIINEKAEVDFLYLSLDKLTEGTEAYAQAKHNLVSMGGEYLQQLIKEKGELAEIDEIYKAVSQDIFLLSQQKALQKSLSAINQKYADDFSNALLDVRTKIYSVLGEKEGSKIWNDFIKDLPKEVDKQAEYISSKYKEIDNAIFEAFPKNLDAATQSSKRLKSSLDSLLKITKKQAKESNILLEIFNTLFKPQEVGESIIGALDRQLAELKKTLLTLTSEDDIAAQNAKIQKIEEERTRILNLGKFTKKQKKDAISLLKEEIDLITSAYAKYQGLINTVGEFDASKIVKETYKAIIPDDKFVFSIDELRKSYDEVIAKLRKLKVSEADILKIKVKLDDQLFKQTQEEIKKKFSDLDREISKRKIANTFFDKLVGTTGDVKLATKLTLDITGRQIEDLRTQLYNDIQSGFAAFGVDVQITPELKLPDIQKEIDKLPKDQQVSLQKLLDNLVQYDMDTITELYSNLSKYEDYEKRRTDIVYKGEEERRKIAEQFSGAEADGLIEASLKKQQRLLASLEFSELKEGGLWQSTFENLERVGSRSLDILTERIQNLLNVAGQDLPIKEYKELVKTLEKLKDEKAARSIFGSITSSVREYTEARRELSAIEKQNNAIITELSAKIEYLKKTIDDVNTSDEERIKLQKELIKLSKERSDAEEGIAKAENKVRSAGQRASSSIRNLSSKFKEIEQTARRTNELMFELADTLGLVSEESKEAWEDIQTIIAGQMEIAQGAADFLEGIYGGGGIGQAINGIGESVNGTLQTIIGFVNYFGNKKLRKINKQIEEQADKIKELGYQYGRLQKAQQSALGGDLAKNYADQAKNIEAQIKATQKQIELENSKKSNKRDKEQIEQWKDDIRDYYDELAELHEQFVQDLLETDTASAAKSFADAWLDAYLSFDNTKDAISASYKDLMKKLVINTVLAQSIQSLVEQIFDDAGALFDSNYNLNQDALKKLVEGSDKFANSVDSILTQLGDALNLRELLGDTLETSLKGISKGVASITEDTALTLGAYLGTIEYYTVAKYNLLQELIEYVKNFDGIIGEDGSGMSTLIAIQNSALAELINIRLNTEIIATNSIELASMFASVRSAKGNNAAFGITISKI